MLSLRVTLLLAASVLIGVSHADAQVPPAHGITEIRISRGACLGRCPVYDFVVTNDGRCHYTGKAHVERVGEFSCLVVAEDFDRVAYLAIEFGFLQMNKRYDRGGTDAATVFTSVVKAGQRREVAHYGRQGPVKLWALEHLVDALMHTATRWEAGPPREPREPRRQKP